MTQDIGRLHVGWVATADHIGTAVTPRIGSLRFTPSRWWLGLVVARPVSKSLVDGTLGAATVAPPHWCWGVSEAMAKTATAERRRTPKRFEVKRAIPSPGLRF